MRLLIINLMIAAGFTAGPLWAIEWDGTGDGTNWTDTANWAGDPVTYPGESGDTNIFVEITGTNRVVLNADITQGDISGSDSDFDLKDGATLTIGTGAVLGNIKRVRLDEGGDGGSMLIMNDGVWNRDATAGGSITIGRVLNVNYAGTTNTFDFNGGSYTNLQPGSAGTIYLGHPDNLATAVLEINGGSFRQSGDIYFGGGTTGNSRLLISGGIFSLGARLWMQIDATDGRDALLQVAGSDASVTMNSSCYLHRNASNTNGSTVVRFILDADGVSPIDATSNNRLYLGTGAERGALEVDVTAMSASGTTGVVLIDYVGTIQGDGTFGSVTVTDDSLGVLTPGTPGSLALGEYALDYADSTTGDGTTIVLYYHNASSGIAPSGSASTNTAVSATGGTFTFGFSIASGATYRVEASTNLVNGAGWSDISGQMTNEAGGDVIYDDPGAATVPTRLYRVTSP